MNTRAECDVSKLPITDFAYEAEDPVTEARSSSIVHESVRPHVFALPAVPKHAVQRIGFKANGRLLILNSDEIIAVQAQGNYVLILNRESKSYLLRESISRIAEALRGYGFVRIHRSLVVNSWLVEEVRPKSTGQYTVRMKGGREFSAARKFRNNLKLLAGTWLGTDPFVVT